MNELIKCQEFLKYFQFYQKTPLKLKEFRQFLKTDFNINDTIDESHSPLMYSMVSGYSEYAKICVEEGANINIQDENGNSPLLLIAQQSYSSYALMEFFLNHGANPNLYNHKNHTALHYVATHNRADLIQLLIDFKADVNLLDSENNHALLLLANEVEYDTTSRLDSLNAFLKSSININQQNKQGNNTLMSFLDHPTQESYKEIISYVKSIVQNGIDLSQINHKKQDAFYFATLTNIATIITLTYHPNVDFSQIDWDFGFSHEITELLNNLEFKQRLDKAISIKDKDNKKSKI